MCPSQGVVSVWASGAAPASVMEYVIPWVLLQGPGCQTLRKGNPRNTTVGDPAAGGGGLSHNTFGIQPPLDTWRPLGHALLDEWIDALARTYGMPRGMAGCLTISAIAGALCSKQRVCLSVDTDLGPQVSWIEAHNGIYFTGVAPSGMRKSPAFDAVMLPWVLRQRILSAGFETRKAAWGARVGKAHSDIERLQGQDSTTQDTLTALHLIANEPTPRAPSLYINNATGAAFANELAYEPHVFVATSEASEVYAAMQSSEGRMELEPFLEAYSGTIGGGTPRISRYQPATGAPRRASMLSMTQPKALYGLGLKHAVALEQGLFARVIWSVCMEAQPTRGAIPKLLQERWCALIHSLMDRPGPARNPWGVESGDPFTVSGSPAQTMRLLEMSERLQARARPGGDLYGVATWVRKLHGQIVRIIAALSCVDALTSTLDESLLEWGLLFAEDYLLPHAQFAWALTRWPLNTDDAQHLFEMARIRAELLGNPRTSFACMEIDRWVPDWSPVQVDEALNTLAARGYVTVIGRQRTDRMVTFV